MKTIKTLITLLLMTISMTATAQTVVVVEKTDGTKDQYPLSEVDSVVYEPKVEVKEYYWWGKSTTETRPSVIDESTASGFTTDGKLASVTIPSDASGAYVLIYPSTWGTLRFEDPNLEGAYSGTDVTSSINISGYNAVVMTSGVVTNYKGLTINLINVDL